LGASPLGSLGCEQGQNWRTALACALRATGQQATLENAKLTLIKMPQGKQMRKKIKVQ
jgi:hypothetical protein